MECANKKNRMQIVLFSIHEAPAKAKNDRWTDRKTDGRQKKLSLCGALLRWRNKNMCYIPQFTFPETLRKNNKEHAYSTQALYKEQEVFLQSIFIQQTIAGGQCMLIVCGPSICIRYSMQETIQEYNKNSPSSWHCVWRAEWTVWSAAWREPSTGQAQPMLSGSLAENIQVLL